MKKLHQLLTEYYAYELISIAGIIMMMIVIFEMVYNHRIKERSNALICLMMTSFCLLQITLIQNNVEFRKAKKSLDELTSYIQYN